MVSAVEYSLKGCGGAADRRPRCALTAEEYVAGEADELALVAVTVIYRIGKCLESLIAADDKIGLSLLPCKHGQTAVQSVGICLKCIAELCCGERGNLGHTALCARAAAADKIAVGIRAAARADNGVDIVAVARRINDRTRIVAARKYGGSRLVSADYTADGRGSADGAGIVAVLNNARSPVLSRYAADIARSSADSAAVVASADRACSVNASDNTANIRAAGDIRLVAAVRHLSCGEFSDDSRSIRRTADLTANDEIAYLTAVYIAEKTDAAAGVDIQSADYVISAVEYSLKGCG